MSTYVNRIDFVTSSAVREEWEGKVVDDAFPLLEWRGGSGDAGVFLTVRQGVQRVAIKLILAEDTEAEEYLAQWAAAKDLSHPHLAAVFESGRCTIQDVNLVYVVTELADRDLFNLLPVNALSAVEAKAIFDPVLDALSYLHSNGYVHGHVKPSNILFVDDQVKLSGDEFILADGVPLASRNPGIYDAPEVAKGQATEASDTWSVGMTLAEAITPRSRFWDASTKGQPFVPESLPEPFSSIVRDCLQPNPAERCAIADIKNQISNVQSVPVVEQIPIIPDRIPDRVCDRVPADEILAPRARGRFHDPEPHELTPVHTLFADYQEANRRTFPVAPFVIGIVVLLALTAVVVVRSRMGKPLFPFPFPTQTAPVAVQPAPPPSSTAAVPAEKPELPASVPPATSQAESQPQDQAESQPQAKKDQKEQPSTTPGETQSAAPAPTQPEPQPQTQPAPPPETPRVPMTGESVPPTESPAPRIINGTRNGSVERRVLPSLSPAAYWGIRGIVPVEIRVNVNRNGAVANASYVSPGAGNYFARNARQAALAWKFRPPVRHGAAEPSVWKLHFVFERGNVEVTAVEIVR
jgi:TonB family protein